MTRGQGNTQRRSYAGDAPGFHVKHRQIPPHEPHHVGAQGSDYGETLRGHSEGAVFHVKHRPLSPTDTP